MSSIERQYKIEDLSHSYDPNDLKWQLERATKDKNHLEQYISQIKADLNGLKQTEYKSVVVFRRNINSYSKKVEYFVWLEKRPQIKEIEDPSVRESLLLPTSKHQCFSGGAEKKTAWEYAEELAGEYGAEIEMVGF